MGISDGLQGSGEEVDCSVGTIVWVRRRNGSWWPGRILGSDELSASHLMSPRSGTPVKLLGREDASVDWYNLEKSKRVKAFRCGEFDDCIERAESSQGIPIKKREKYARREDAILHALELERELLEKKQQKLGSASCVSSKLPLKKEVGIPKGNLDHCRFLNLKSQTLLKGFDSSEEESMGNPLYARYNEHGKELSLADDKCESIPRMRGLQDLGLRTGSSKRKNSASVDSEGPKKSFAVDNNVHAFPNGSRITGAADHVSNIKNSLALKRKRTQGGLVEESLIKKRDRRRPLLQVLKSSAKLSTSNSLQSDGDLISLSMKVDREQKGVLYRAKRSQCAYLPGASSDCLDLPSDQGRGVPSQLEIDNCRFQPDFLMEDSTFSGSKEVAESDSSERDYLNLDMDEETAVFSDSSPVLTGAVPSNSGRFVNNHMVQGQQGSMSSEELDESAVTGHTPNLHPHDQTATGASDVGVSKWQLKGKRNIRNLMKRSVEMDGNSSNGFLKGSLLDGKGNIINQRSLGHGLYHESEDLGYYDDDDLTEKAATEKAATETQMLRLGNKRYRSMLKSSFRDHNGSNTDVIDPEEDLVWDEDGLSQAALKGYWDESAECFNPIYVGHRPASRKDSLVDVDLKVQTSYQGEHVPLVSLMSRLNGKAIIGHPIQIETLEDGFSDHLLPVSDDFGEVPTDYDGNTALTPVWRTARRTVMHRVPRPHPSKVLEGDDVVGHSQYSDLDYKPTYKKLYSRQMKRPPTEKKCSKKLLKRMSLSNQKTRTLSSIAIEQKLNGRNLKPANQKNLDGLIKSEIGPTTVACIPVKLAFSRLLEAVGKPPSRTLIHSVSANGDTEKRPS